MYDMQGKLISTLPSRTVQAGWNEWKTSKYNDKLTPGAMVFKLIIDAEIQEGQIVILR